MGKKSGGGNQFNLCECTDVTRFYDFPPPLKSITTIRIRIMAPQVNSNQGSSGGGQAPSSGSQSSGQTNGTGHSQPAQKQQFSQADLNRIVLEYLNKKGYVKTEATLRMESSHTTTPQHSTPTPSNSSYPTHPNSANNSNNSNSVGSRSSYLESPEVYNRGYTLLKDWVQTSLELYRSQLQKLLYPIFVHCYLDMIKNGSSSQARVFFNKFSKEHLLFHQSEIDKLSGINLIDHLKENELAKAFKNNKYRVTISRTALNLLLYFLHENDGVGGNVIIRLLNQYIDSKVSDSVSINNFIAGNGSESGPAEILDEEDGIPGYNAKLSNFNNTKVLLGPLPKDPDLTKEVEAELKQLDQETGEHTNGLLIDTFNKIKQEEDAIEDKPLRDTIPFPPSTAFDVEREIEAIKDARAKIHLGPYDSNTTTNGLQTSLPSVVMYTFHNTHDQMNCIEFDDSVKLVAGGFQDSFVKLWSLDGSPLESILQNTPSTNSNINVSPDPNDLSMRRLVGHSDSIYGLSFSPDSQYLLSASGDHTTRLWSLATYTALVSYKSHTAPVWDVSFSPFGHYFATGSHDQTARLWSCDHIYPLRIFAGHLNDVDVVKFHPNSQYVVTGSADKSCRLWDINTGNSVRVFIEQQGSINCVEFSPDGRWIATAGEDSCINVWDIGSGKKLKSMRGHGKCSIYGLSWSQDGTVLVSCGSDYSVRCWDIRKGTQDSGPEPEQYQYALDPSETINLTPGNSSINNVNGSSTSGNADGKKGNDRRQKEVTASHDHMAAWFTKKTAVYNVKFTRRNLCLAAGAYIQS